MKKVERDQPYKEENPSRPTVCIMLSNIAVHQHSSLLWTFKIEQSEKNNSSNASVEILRSGKNETQASSFIKFV